MNTSPRAIHHLNCGTMCPRAAALIFAKDKPPHHRHMVCHCLLIEGAEGLVLVDTGFGLDDIREPRRLGRPFNALTRPRLDDAETAISQVRALGFDPTDVRHVVITHLDPDHGGGLPDFPEAEVHLLGAELRAAMNPNWRERPRYVPSHVAHSPRWVEHDTSGGDRWHGFESVHILPHSDAEILLIPLRGHTLGLAGVAIKRPDGSWLLHCGDAYFDDSEVQTPPRSTLGLRAFAAFDQVDGAARRQNLERLRELAARSGARSGDGDGERVELICSHDATTLARCREQSPASATTVPQAI